MPPVHSSSPSFILGIESSCDETGVALVDRERRCHANQLHSQVAMHRDYGGVVPELASRDHLQRLAGLLEGCLADAGCGWRDIEAIAVTVGPGLPGALMAGASFAYALAAARGLPVWPVHHMEGHLLSPFLRAVGDPDPAPDAPAEVDFPFTALLVSGGHTMLLAADALGQYRCLGETIDDAVGEAFDKTAYLLGLGYPGGAALAALAEQGDAHAYDLPQPMRSSGDLRMSFSGLKTAVLVTLCRELGVSPNAPDVASSLQQGLTPVQKANMAASFQRVVVAILLHKLEAALRLTGHRHLVIAGGVSANRELRLGLADMASRLGIRLHLPTLAWCTDNGAMIALVGAMHAAAGTIPAHDYRIFTRPRWPLAS